MKKLAVLFYIIFMSYTTIHSQEPIALNEVTISKNIDVKSILKKIRKELSTNCDTTDYKFQMYMYSKINDDTLLFINENIKLKIKSFNNQFIKKYSDTLLQKIKSTDKKIFTKYIEHSSPLGWLSDYPIRKNLNTIHLDFLKNHKNYKYELNKINDNENLLSFFSDSLYNGKILYNSKTKKPISIEYSNSKPYLFTHISSQNFRTVNNFESSWFYTIEKVFIKFQNKIDKIYLSSLNIEEEIKDFEYKTFNKSGGILYTEKNNFSTSIILNKNE